MGRINHTESFTSGATTMQRSADVDGDADIHYGGKNVPIPNPVGRTVTAWVKTDANTADCNLPADHGYASGKFDVYDVDGVLIRHGVDGVVNANALALDGGAGSDFPASTTAGIVVCKQKEVDVDIRGPRLSGLAVCMYGVGGHVAFQDQAGATIRAISLPADTPDMWDADQEPNPYAGNAIVKAMISNGSAATAGTFEVIGAQDCTP
jgi:hypothetical protein